MISEVLVSITGKTIDELLSKVEELKKYNINRFALFVEWLKKEDRQKIYSKLLESNTINIPFMHARHDMQLDEYKFLEKKFNTKYFNLHINVFDLIETSDIKPFRKRLLYELSYKNTITDKVDMKKIGGFCVDISHLAVSKYIKTNEYKFIMKNKNNKELFKANHISGYIQGQNYEKHDADDISDFNYLKNIPKFVFGKYIAIEVYDSIKDQLKYKKHIEKILNSKGIILSQ